VAASALAASRAGRFLVAPPEWSAALTARTRHLLDGIVPAIPVPADARLTARVAQQLQVEAIGSARLSSLIF
jgi:hypothetical protein